MCVEGIEIDIMPLLDGKTKQKRREEISHSHMMKMSHNFQMNLICTKLCVN